MAAPTFLQNHPGANLGGVTGDNTMTAWSGAVTVGSARYIHLRLSGVTDRCTGVKDNAGNAFTLLNKFSTGTGGTFNYVWERLNTASTAHTGIIVTLSSGTTIRMQGCELGGAATSAANDGILSGVFTSSATPTTPTTTTGYTDERIVCFFSTDAATITTNTFTPGAGWTEAGEFQNRMELIHRDGTTAGTWTGSCTLSVGADKGAYFIFGVKSTTSTPSGGGVVVPSFSPVHASSTTSSNTYSATPNLGGDTSATWHMSVYVNGSATPTAAQVRTGAGTGFISHFSKSVTGVDTQTSSGLTFPVHDYHQILTNSAGDSTVMSDTDRLKTAPATYQYQTLFTPIVAGSYAAGQSPAVASGDVAILKLVTSPGGYAITPGSDGDLNIALAGDTARQLIDYNIYDKSVGDFYFSADSTHAVNDQAPVANLPVLPIQFFPLGVPISPVNLVTLGGVTDPESDAITVTNTDALGSGMSVASPNLTGTPVAGGLFNTTIRYTDEYGQFTETTLPQLVGDVLIPDVVGSPFAEAEVDLTTAYFNFAYGPTVASATLALGVVAAQSQTGFAAPGTVITLNLVGSIIEVVTIEYGTITFYDNDKVTTKGNLQGYYKAHPQKPPGLSSDTPKKTPDVLLPAAHGSGNNYSGRK